MRYRELFESSETPPPTLISPSDLEFKKYYAMYQGDAIQITDKKSGTIIGHCAKIGRRWNVKMVLAVTYPLGTISEIRRYEASAANILEKDIPKTAISLWPQVWKNKEQAEAAREAAILAQRKKAEEDMTRPIPAYDGENHHEILRLHDIRDESDFEVLVHQDERHTATTPLVIVIHPGDMIETGDAFDSWKTAEKVKQFSQDNQAGTASELAAWREKGYDIVVLHRGSCSQFQDIGDEDLSAELFSAWDHGSILFGDDLKAAGNWIIKNLHVADRPHIYLAGAYSTPRNGCLTAIGKMVEKVVGEDRITVSDWSPGGNSDRSSVWRPGNRKLPFWHAQGNGWRKNNA